MVDQDSWQPREQTPREELELRLLALLARTYLDQPVRVARLLVKKALVSEHFSDATIRDAFQRLRAAILANDKSGELLNALHLLADSTDVQRNLEELVEELCALGTVLEPEAR
jgi:hypothetical protein